MSVPTKRVSAPFGNPKGNVKCPKEKLPSYMKKPIVLSSQRYGKIKNNAYQMDKQKAQREAEEEQKYKEYLKTGNDRLVAQFTSNMQRTQNMKIQQMKIQMEKKEKQVRLSLEQTKENAERIRRRKIAEAQVMLEKLKPGPRQLNSALLQSEVLRARKVQQHINQEFERAVKTQEDEHMKICEQMGANWINEEQKRLEEQQKAKYEYKQEMLQDIRKNQRAKAETKKKLIAEEQAAREALDIEIKAQVEKEKALMEKKKDTLRKNALEAMRMLEQRRRRYRIVEEMEDRLCCVYNTGKTQLDMMQSETNKNIMEEKSKKEEQQIEKMLIEQNKIKAIESERYRRDISTMQLKFTAAEKEKVERERAAKKARIEAYLKETNQQKIAQNIAMEERRFDMANRYKNMEVNCMFDAAQKQEQERKKKEIREKLCEQMEDRKNMLAVQKHAAEIACKDESVEKEHQFYFQYARNLMEDAQKKGRPLYPFVKAVQQYKRDNQIDCYKKIPKHLESQIIIGEQPCIPNNNVIYSANKNVKNTIKKTGSVIRNCLKIDDIIAKDGPGPNNEVDVGKCMLECPYNNKIKLSQQKSPTCENASGGVPSTNKVRYSMEELKQMYQFVPPHKCF